MRLGALLAILLLGFSGCAGLQAIFKPPPPAPEGPPPTAPVPAARPPAPPPPLTPEMSRKAERHLLEEAQRKIRETDRLLQQLEGRQMKPDEREMFLTAQDFLEQARRALAAREYQRAANLASKAHALSDDLAAVTKR